MKWIVTLMLCGALTACAGSTDTPAPKADDATTFPVTHTDAEWRAKLSPKAYQVLRQHATERPFTGALLHNPAEGVYTCAGCGQDLFTSGDKFDSGTGWPSYTRPVNKQAVGESRDTSYGTVRTEVHCSRCGGHLGHVFEDGPAPTGLRYCINSVSLGFRAAEKP